MKKTLITIFILSLMLISGCSPVGLEDGVIQYTSFDDDTCEEMTICQSYNSTHNICKIVGCNTELDEIDYWRNNLENLSTDKINKLYDEQNGTYPFTQSMGGK